MCAGTRKDCKNRESKSATNGISEGHDPLPRAHRVRLNLLRPHPTPRKQTRGLASTYHGRALQEKRGEKVANFPLHCNHFLNLLHQPLMVWMSSTSRCPGYLDILTENRTLGSRRTMRIVQRISPSILAFVYLTASCLLAVQFALPGVGLSGQWHVRMAAGPPKEMPRQAIRQYKHLPVAKAFSVARVIVTEFPHRRPLDEYVFYVSCASYASPLQDTYFFPLFNRPPPRA